jgi:hypothetical protein
VLNDAGLVFDGLERRNRPGRPPPAVPAQPRCPRHLGHDRPLRTAGRPAERGRPHRGPSP